MDFIDPEEKKKIKENLPVILPLAVLAGAGILLMVTEMILKFANLLTPGLNLVFEIIFWIVMIGCLIWEAFAQMFYKKKSQK